LPFSALSHNSLRVTTSPYDISTMSISERIPLHLLWISPFVSGTAWFLTLSILLITWFAEGKPYYPGQGDPSVAYVLTLSSIYHIIHFCNLEFFSPCQPGHMSRRRYVGPCVAFLRFLASFRSVILTSPQLYIRYRRLRPQTRLCHWLSDNRTLLYPGNIFCAFRPLLATHVRDT
jgi:hypothetical protein